MKYLLFCLVFFLTLSDIALGGKAVIFQGNFVKALKDQFKLSETAYVLTGTTDPTSLAVDAPLGSLFIKTDTGDLYQKLDAGSSTNWERLLANIVEDLTPQLGADLEGQAFDINDITELNFAGSPALRISGSTMQTTAGATDMVFNTVGGGRFVFNNNVIPDGIGTRDLGLPGAEWSDLHVQNTVTFDGPNARVKTENDTVSDGLTISTGDASAGNSGRILLQTGSSTATRGIVDIDADRIVTEATSTDADISYTFQNLQTGNTGILAQFTQFGTAAPGVYVLQAGASNTEPVLRLETNNTAGTGVLLRLENQAADTIDIGMPTAVTDYDITLPAAQGGDSTILQNDGSGNLSWVNRSSGEVNYLSGSNTNYENTLGDWITYDDAAAAPPITSAGGTGGSPAMTFTRTTSASDILRGTASGTFTGAPVALGEGISVDFDIEPADAGKILKVQFEYTFAGDTGDLGVFVHCDLDGTVTRQNVTAGSDGTNNNVILSKSARGGSPFVGTFLAPDDLTDLDCRLMIHNISEHAQKFVIDDVIIGPGQIAQGAVVTDWEDWDPEGGGLTSWTTNTTHDCERRRVGANLELRCQVDLTGPPNTTTLNYTMPDSLTIDTSASRDHFGTGYMRDQDTAGNRSTAHVVYNNASSIVFEAHGAGTLSATAPFTWTNLDRFNWDASIPIIQWAGQGVVNLIKEDNLSEWIPFNTQLKGTTTDPARGTGGNSNDSSWYRRVGNSAEIQFNWGWGTAANSFGSGTYYFSVADDIGLTVDSSVLKPSSFASVIGSCRVFDNSATDRHFDATAFIDGSQRIVIGAANNNASTNSVTPTSPFTFGNSDIISCFVKVPILEWSNQPSPLIGFAGATTDRLGLTIQPTFDHENYTTNGTQTSAANTWTDASLTDLVLEPGTYIVGYSVTVRALNNTAGAISVPCNVRIYDETGAAAVTGTVGLYNPNLDASGSAYGDITRMVPLVLTATSTLRLETRGITSNRQCDIRGGNFTASLTDPDVESGLWAVKLDN